LGLTTRGSASGQGSIILKMDEQDKGNFEPLAERPAQTTIPSVPLKGEEDYAEGSRQAGSYLNMPPAEPKEPLDEPEKSDHRNLIISFVILICLALLAGGIYWFNLKKS